MAPTAAAQSLQGHRPRPSIAKPIVPAIPYSYMQKRKTVAVPKKIEEDPASALPLAPISNTEPSSAASSPKLEDLSLSAPDQSYTSSEKVPVSSTLYEESASTPTTPAAVLLAESSEDQSHEDLKATPVPEEESERAPPLVSSDMTPSDPRSTYNMPPPFVPSSNGLLADASGQPYQAPPKFNGHTLHQTQPSNGSTSFVPYTESNGSSPAPPLSGGINQAGQPQFGAFARRVPTQDMTNGQIPHYATGGPPHMGAPHNGQYARQELYINYGGHDNSGSRRSMPHFGNVDTSSSIAGPPGLEGQRLNEMSQQSFHSSQSSAPFEQDVNGQLFYNQYNNSGGMSSGTHGQIEDGRSYHFSRPKPRTGSQGIVGPGHHPHSSFGAQQMYPGRDDLDGLIPYLQAQFGRSQFADYTLELRYSDDRATPVRLNGHNLLFARSPTLKNLMAAQSQDAGDNELALLRILLIESADRFLRSDAFQLAIQRLYGAPLLDLGVPTAMLPSMPSNIIPGTPNERFDLALGYAAAGHLLQMPPVVYRGIEVAGQLISWQTVERALDFALDGGLDMSWSFDLSRNIMSLPTYGPDVNMLIQSTLNFIITSFPPNFELNSAVSEASFARRIPVVPELHVTQQSRLSTIRFGDHDLEEDAACPPAVDNNVPANILSKILISLPFNLLKYVLESSRLGNVSGWATTVLRQKVMHSVIQEREKRRIKSQQSKSVDDCEREAKERDWEAVGWRESIGIVSPNNESILTREWVGFLLDEK